MIIDTTMFNKDFTTLGIRLAELYNVVDLFIICESRFTFSGIPKALFLTENIEQFNKYASKIRIVVEDKKHLTNIAMIRETHQRKKISRYLKSIKVSPNDLILYSDCDEIPRAEVIENLSKLKNVNALLEFRGFSNYLNMESDLWPRGRAVTFNNYLSIENLRQDIFLSNLEPRSGLKKFYVRVPYYWTTREYYLWNLPLRFDRPKLDLIKNAGWHFNNLFLADDIYDKIKSSAHTEYNTPEIMGNAIENYLNGRDIYTGRKYKYVEIDNTYPKDVLSNINRYKDFIFTEKKKNEC